MAQMESGLLRLREYVSADCPVLADLFYDTVHTVCKKDYEKVQRDAWADGNPDLADWDRSFLEHQTVVAVLGDQIVGFADMDSAGYLDRLYVHKDFQRQGIGSALCDFLECGAGDVVTHASITARPFFAGRGYQVVKEQQVERAGVFLTNYVMKKHQTKNSDGSS